MIWGRMDGTEIKEVPQPPSFVSGSPWSRRGSCDSAVGGLFWAVKSHSSWGKGRSVFVFHRSRTLALSTHSSGASVDQKLCSAPD